MILSEAEFFGPETRRDECEHRFQQLVTIGESIVDVLKASDDKTQISFSYEIGYTMPVFLAATRCRDPIIRKRAVRFLGP